MKLPRITEDEFLAQVLEYAAKMGWLRAHFRPAKTAHGWRTPCQAEAKGFPDLVLVRERVVYAETKSETGKLTPEQTLWIEKLAAAGQEVYVWRPKDWDEVLTVLGKPNG